MPDDPTSAEAFEQRYREAEDPWDFRTSSYERGRYERIVAALGRPRYRSAYEPGCSIGELTWRLAERCDRLVAVDISATAIAAARQRCDGLDGVDVRVGSVVDEPPAGLDLLVFSEVGYYLDVPRLDEVLDRLTDAVEPGGEVIACHWLGESPDHVLHGRTVHERLAAVDRLVARHHEEHEGFVLDAWERR